MHQIGEDRTERLDIVPAQLRVLVDIRPKYACNVCSDGVTQAPAAPRLIEGGLPTEGAIAHALVSKFKAATRRNQSNHSCVAQHIRWPDDCSAGHCRPVQMR